MHFLHWHNCFSYCCPASLNATISSFTIPHAEESDVNTRDDPASVQVQDYGDVVIHVFEPAQREYYDLEGFYGAAEEV